MNTTSMILKTDGRGRVRTPRQRREELLAEFGRSGLPATQFAALVGVRYQTFATWVQQYKKRCPSAESAARSKPVRFAEVVRSVTAPSLPVKMLRVLLPGGAVIELHEVTQVPLAAQLIQVLQPSC